MLYHHEVLVRLKSINIFSSKKFKLILKALNTKYVKPTESKNKYTDCQI